MEYPLLLEPITLAGRTVRNRVVHASMSTRYTRNQDIDPRLVRYHANRAAGGVGMIVTEPLNVLPWHDRPHRPALFEPNALDDLARWADSVESRGCRLLGQFQDSGRGHREVRPLAAGLGTLGAAGRPQLDHAEGNAPPSHTRGGRAFRQGRAPA